MIAERHAAASLPAGVIASGTADYPRGPAMPASAKFAATEPRQAERDGEQAGA
jgi:hypothetical protein